MEGDDICFWWEQCKIAPSLRCMCVGVVQRYGVQGCVWQHCGLIGVCMVTVRVCGLQGCACHRFRVTGLPRCACACCRVMELQGWALPCCGVMGL